jgi:hypothetical protein
MKPPLLLLLLLAAPAFGENVVVFGECDTYPAGSERPAPKDPARAQFLAASRADLGRAGALEQSLPLVSPPAWGKTVGPLTHGEIRFHPSFAGGLECHLALSGLLPSHRYILTLNGNASLPGNDLLPMPVPGNPKEKYYDFLVVTTDASGAFDAGLGVFLKPGAYDARCYVKDRDDFKIVLYRDYFPFEVK